MELFLDKKLGVLLLLHHLDVTGLELLRGNVSGLAVRLCRREAAGGLQIGARLAGRQAAAGQNKK